MHPYLQNIAIIAYVCAMGLALAHLVQRQAYVHRLAVLATLVGWIAHTLALVVLAIEIGGPPLGTLPNAVSVVVWVVVLLEMLVERQSGVTVLGAFVLPVVVVLSLKSSVARPVTLAPALGNAWIWIHIALALVGIAAFVLNFAGAIMYLLQERQIRHKRPGRFYHRLPPLETLDRWTYRTLALGFPFLTTGLILGAVWARTAWGSVFAFDPLRLMPLFAAGISHKNAPLALREQLAADEGKVREILRDLVGGGVLREAVILSTCNRVEVYGVADVPGEARAVAFRHLCRQRGVEVAAVEEVLYTHAEDDPIRHAFRVASSLDSMMIGEPQILGQVKDAFALAQGCEAVGPALHTLFTQAFAVAKRVRTETEIARHAVSVSFAAVELAKKIFARLAGRAVLLVGAGKMSELAAKHLVEQGAFPIYVVNRTWARAQEMARALSGTAVPFEELEMALAAVDIVITSTGAPTAVVTRDVVARVVRGRGTRPLFFIDIAVPRDVEPGVDALPAVYRYDIDDLKSVVDANIRERLHEAQRAEALVEREVAKLRARLGDVEIIPTIVSLRERLEEIRTGEVRKALARLPAASPETRAAIEALSAGIVNKILHAPITKLRESSRAGAHRSWLAVVHELFGLGRRS